MFCIENDVCGTNGSCTGLCKEFRCMQSVGGNNLKSISLCLYSVHINVHAGVLF